MRILQISKNMQFDFPVLDEQSSYERESVLGEIKYLENSSKGNPIFLQKIREVKSDLIKSKINPRKALNLLTRIKGLYEHSNSINNEKIEKIIDNTDDWEGDVQFGSSEEDYEENEFDQVKNLYYYFQTILNSKYLTNAEEVRYILNSPLVEKYPNIFVKEFEEYMENVFLKNPDFKKSHIIFLCLTVFKKYLSPTITSIFKNTSTIEGIFNSVLSNIDEGQTSKYFHDISSAYPEEATKFVQLLLKKINNLPQELRNDYANTLRKMALYSFETSDVFFNYENGGSNQYFEMFADKASSKFLDDSMLARLVAGGQINHNVVENIFARSVSQNKKLTKISNILPSMLSKIDIYSYADKIKSLIEQNSENKDFVRTLMSGFLQSNLDQNSKDKVLLLLSNNKKCLSEDSIEHLTPIEKMKLVTRLGIFFNSYHGTSQDTYEKIKKSGKIIAGGILDNPVGASRPTSFRQFSNQIYISSNKGIAQYYCDQKARKMNALILQLKVPIYHLYEAKLILGLLDPQKFLNIMKYKCELSLNYINDMIHSGKLVTVKDLCCALYFLNSLIEATIIAELDKSFIVNTEKKVKSFGRYKILKVGETK